MRLPFSAFPGILCLPLTAGVAGTAGAASATSATGWESRPGLPPAAGRRGTGLRGGAREVVE